MSVRFLQKYISLRNIRHFGNQAIVYIGVLDIFINSPGFISLTFFGNQNKRYFGCYTMQQTTFLRFHINIQGNC